MAYIAFAVNLNLNGVQCSAYVLQILTWSKERENCRVVMHFMHPLLNKLMVAAANSVHASTLMIFANYSRDMELESVCYIKTG